MTVFLDTLNLTNFRTIRGAVSIPLNGSVVLVYGANGAGKTSLLSAIELALTGSVEALRDHDSDYAANLAHKGTTDCRIQLTSHVDGALGSTGEISVTNGTIDGEPLLFGEDRRYFAERCFLAQSRLSRLLEIYQRAEARQESPLVQFVNELLGLDHLDHLVVGLHEALDERRLRRLVPEFADRQQEESQLATSTSRARSQLQTLRSTARERFS